MTLKRLKIIRLVFLTAAICLLAAGGASGVVDYQSWKQKNESAVETTQVSIEETSVCPVSPEIPEEEIISEVVETDSDVGEGVPESENTNLNTAGTVSDAGGSVPESENTGSSAAGTVSDAGESVPESENTGSSAAGTVSGSEKSVSDGEESEVPTEKSSSETDLLADLNVENKENNSVGTAAGSGSVSENQTEAFSISLRTLILLICGAACIVISAILSVVMMICRKPLESVSKEKQERKQKEVSVSENSVPHTEEKTLQVKQSEVFNAQFNRIGKRPRQEDCCGVLPMENAVLAVVADGMGGLKNSEKVSELVVRSMMEQGQRLKDSTENGILLPMLSTTNEIVNQSLGDDICESGSTLLAVWVQKKEKTFQWIAVGDSRIYLYRGGSMIQLNQEHNYGQELLNMAVKGQISFEEARKTPGKRNLTSFIGMGQLKYVDHSIQPIDLQAGDRILLMTDGVFNDVSDQQMTQVLQQTQDVWEAAKKLAGLVEQVQNPKQDNYTAVILSV